MLNNDKEGLMTRITCILWTRLCQRYSSKPVALEPGPNVFVATACKQTAHSIVLSIDKIPVRWVAIRPLCDTLIEILLSASKTYTVITLLSGTPSIRKFCSRRLHGRPPESPESPEIPEVPTSGLLGPLVITGTETPGGGGW